MAKLLDRKQVAEMLPRRGGGYGVNPLNVTARPGFPEPVARDPMRWRLIDVQRYVRAREKPQERPKPRCATHGRRYMRVPDSGKEYCVRCSRERAARARERRRVKRDA